MNNTNPQPGIGFLIKLVSEHIEKKANQDLRELGITLAQMRVMDYLYIHKNESVSQRDLEEHLHVSHPTVVGIIHRLESKGLITSESNSYDKRVKNITLSGHEQSYFEKITELRANTEAVLLDGISEADCLILRQLLTQMFKNLYKNVK